MKDKARSDEMLIERIEIEEWKIPIFTGSGQVVDAEVDLLR